MQVIVIDVLTILDLFEMFGVIELQVFLSIDITIGDRLVNELEKKIFELAKFPVLSGPGSA
jgi:hypothetical protein